MNPYLEAVLEPQFAGARSDFLKAQRDLQSRYSQAGAYGVVDKVLVREN